MSEAREDLPGVLLWERFTAFSINLSGQTVCDAGVYLCVFVFLRRFSMEYSQMTSPSICS